LTSKDTRRCILSRVRLLFTFALKNTEAFSRNIFRSQSWYQGTLFSIYAGANSEATTLQLVIMVRTQDSHYQSMFSWKVPSHSKH